ncbi:hypothetical protein HYW20_03305 [Candidatus Woesearchaeota archaeon]|nr:hypothetical protein [Candidatus Woesearchaeota archaeon]
MRDHELRHAEHYFSSIPLMTGESITMQGDTPEFWESLGTARKAVSELKKYGKKGLEHLASKFYIPMAVSTGDSQHIVRLLYDKLGRSDSITLKYDDIEQIVRVLDTYIQIVPYEVLDNSKIVQEAGEIGLKEELELLGLDSAAKSL